jgi:hypothetical protein
MQRIRGEYLRALEKEVYDKKMAADKSLQPDKLNL